MLRCPGCGTASVSVALSMMLGADDEWEERSLQVIECGACRFSGVATQSTGHRDARERVMHLWHPHASADDIRHTIPYCASPQDPRCACMPHQLARKLAGDPKYLAGAIDLARGGASAAPPAPMTGPAPSRRTYQDDRLRALRAFCPDDGARLSATGEIFNTAEDPDAPFWVAGFVCENHPDEVIRLWQPEFDPVIRVVLADVDRGPPR